MLAQLLRAFPGYQLLPSSLQRSLSLPVSVVFAALCPIPNPPFCGISPQATSAWTVPVLCPFPIPCSFSPDIYSRSL